MRKHRKQTDTTARDGAHRDWLALTELTGRGARRAAGWLSFCVCHALNAPLSSDRPDDQARAQRIGMAVATASIGR
ncbi:hypothetical protein [Streptomyces erythrochromogenes]|uniref:hypothetical protein n=1 Tax=Streptomyces erythrochromogenes TaxID=285574 RepID=UPI0038704D1E|nr:hypothetical protein OG364_02020 [Streptomyces erythrochromogenes]